MFLNGKTIMERIDYAMNLIKETYGKNIHSIWLTGSCAKDYPNLEGEYADIDLIVFTWARTNKRIDIIFMKDFPDIDIGVSWFPALYYRKRLLNSPIYHYATEEFMKHGVRLR